MTIHLNSFHTMKKSILTTQNRMKMNIPTNQNNSSPELQSEHMELDKLAALHNMPLLIKQI
jgi:hypothetical protein